MDQSDQASQTKNGETSSMQAKEGQSQQSNLLPQQLNAQGTSKRKRNDCEPVMGGQSAPKSSNESDITQETGKKVKKKKLSKKGVDPKVLDVRRKVQVCCQTNDLLSAIEAYESAVDDGIKIEPQSFYNLLSLCDGLERTVHIGTPKEPQCASTATKPREEEQTACQTAKSSLSSPTEVRQVDETKRLEYAYRLKQRMDDLGVALTETAYTALVRLLSRNRKVEDALQLVKAAEKVQQCKPKLRLYSSLLIAYCDMDQLTNALELRKMINDVPDITLTEKEYAALLRCTSKSGHSTAFEVILSDLAEDILVPSKVTIAAIVEWFRSEASKTQRENPLESDDTINKLLEDGRTHNRKASATGSVMLVSQEPPPPMGPVLNSNGWTISESCQIDTSVGRLVDGCLRGGILQPVPLSDKAWGLMKKYNGEIASQGHVDGNSNSKFQGGKKGKIRNDFSRTTRQEQWSNFCAFLKRLEEKQRKPDVVLDGANIGYYEKNFAGAPRHVDYLQIDWVVRHFIHRLKKRVLIVMHQRHFAPKFMPDKFRYLEKEWIRLGVLYKTPNGMNDDWFWLHAALEYQALVVTNDEMRDHHFQMLAPRMFLRWKERHQVHFSFGGWERNSYQPQRQGNEPDCFNNHRPRKSREVQLEYPDVYSRRVQRVKDGLVIPLAKRGDTHRFLDGSYDAGEDALCEERYLCIRPASQATESC